MTIRVSENDIQWIMFKDIVEAVYLAEDDSFESLSELLEQKFREWEARLQQSLSSTVGEESIASHRYYDDEIIFRNHVDIFYAEKLIKEANSFNKHNWQGAFLEGLDLSGRILKDVDFSYANLKGANFSGSILKNIDFSEADLSGANFTSSNLNSVKFDGANLSNVSFANVSFAETSPPPSFTCLPLPPLSIENADFSYANLENADFSYSTFIECDFSDAAMSGIVLCDTKFVRCSNLPSSVIKDSQSGKCQITKEEEASELCPTLGSGEQSRSLLKLATSVNQVVLPYTQTTKQQVVVDVGGRTIDVAGLSNSGGARGKQNSSKSTVPNPDTMRA